MDAFVASGVILYHCIIGLSKTEKDEYNATWVHLQCLEISEMNVLFVFTK